MNPQEKRRLEKFIEVAERLFNSRFIQNTKKIQLTIDLKAGEESIQKIEGFDEEDMRSALLDIRKLISPTDGIKFDDICRLIIQHAPTEQIRVEVQKWLETYEKWMNESHGVVIKTGEKVDENIEIILNWIYGFYLHEDDQRKEKLEKNPITQMTSKLIFVNLTLTLPRLAHGLAKYAKEVLDA